MQTEEMPNAFFIGFYRFNYEAEFHFIRNWENSFLMFYVCNISDECKSAIISLKLFFMKLLNYLN